ncbi:MAG: cellulase family glycosylhydrolase [Candidatus Hodarchaeota archaeon]
MGRSNNKNQKATKTILLFLMFGCGGFLIPMSQYWGVSPPEPQLTWNGQPFRPIGFNYYPSVECWKDMWKYWDNETIANDFQIIKSLGGNCIRTFIHWQILEQDFGVYNTTIVDRVVEFFQLAEDAGLAIQLGFFDGGIPELTPKWWNDDGWENDSYYDAGWTGFNRSDFSPDEEGEAEYKQALNDAKFTNQSIINREVAQLELLIPLLKNYSSAFIWDIMNEPASSNVPVEVFADWVENMSTTIRAVDPDHLVTVGGGYGNFEDPALFAQYLDVVCAHTYRDRDGLRWERSGFRSYLKPFIATGKPVMVQEVGWNTFAISESRQADNYRTVFSAGDEMGLAGIMFWCLWDYALPFWDENERAFGVLRDDGSWKPAAHVFQSYMNETFTYSTNWRWDGLNWGWLF